MKIKKINQNKIVKQVTIKKQAVQKLKKKLLVKKAIRNKQVAKKNIKPIVAGDAEQILFQIKKIQASLNQKFTKKFEQLNLTQESLIKKFALTKKAHQTKVNNLIIKNRKLQADLENQIMVLKADV